jgi:hypothetical protein
MITVTDERVLELIRGEIAAAVERERPLVRQEIIDSFKWVTEETAFEMFEIEGKDPRRTFRRAMTTYGVEVLKLGIIGPVLYRLRKRKAPAKHGGISIEELIELRATKLKPVPRKDVA